LSACTTADERDRVLGNITDEVLVILNSRPGLTRRWLLGLDRVNRRFAVSSGHRVESTLGDCREFGVGWP